MFLWTDCCKYSYVTVVSAPAGKALTLLSRWLEGDSDLIFFTDGLPKAMVAIWVQQGADFCSCLVTLGWVCPRSVSWSSNGCNSLEDLITTQAVFRDMLVMLKPLPFNYHHFFGSKMKPFFCLHLKRVWRVVKYIQTQNGCDNKIKV